MAITKELREILQTQLLEKIADNSQGNLKPDFNLIQYQETIQEKYAHLRLDSLDTSGYAYSHLKLWRIFIAQNVRESQEYLPKVYEIPKDYQRRLRESGELERELSLEELERQQRVYSQQSIRSVLEVVEDKSYPYIVILGNPGAGKSALL